jgi:hypothetical protein
MGRGSRVEDGDNGLSPPVPAQDGCPPDLAWCRHTCRAADFFVCGSRSGKGQDQSSWLQSTDYRLQTPDSRLQHSMNNEMRGGEKSRGERDEGLKTDTRTIDTKPFWTLATLVRSNCDAGGGF